MVGAVALHVHIHTRHNYGCFFVVCFPFYVYVSLSLSMCVCVVHIFSIINCRQSGSFTYDDHTDHIFRKLRYTLQIFNEKKKKMSKDYKSQRN